MTVEELVEALSGLDPSTLVCVDTNGFSRGIYPVADETTEMPIAMDAESYHCVVLVTSKWPEAGR